MKKKVLITICVIVVLIGIVAIVNYNSRFNEYSTNNNDYSNSENLGLSNIFEKARNKQIVATILSDEKSDYEQPTYFKYALTNENEYLDTIYSFNDYSTDVESYINSKSFDILESMYSFKYCYTYENADGKGNIFIKEFAHFPESDQREYDGWYRYIRDYENNNKIIEEESIDLEGNDRHEVTVYHHTKNYDENGNISFAQNLGYKDEVDSETQFIYNENGDLEHKYWSNRFNDYYDYNFIYEKDSEGNIRRVTTNKDDTPEEMYDFEYDLDGNITNSIKYTFDSNGEKHHKQTLEYQYDSNGNIIQEDKEYYDSIKEKYEYSQINYYYNENQNLKKIVEQKNNGETKYTYFIYTDTPSEYFADNQ